MQVHMAKRFYVVDIKHQSVVGNLDRIAMKRLDVDLGSLLIAGRSRSSMMMDKVAVHGLINEIIAIQMFHNINLPTGGPPRIYRFFRHQPNGGPGSWRQSAEPCSDFDPMSRTKSDLTQTPYTAASVNPVFLPCPQDQFPLLDTGFPDTP